MSAMSDGMYIFEIFPYHDYACLLGRCKDCIEKCRMMLLLMRRFPDVIPKNGVFI